MDPLDNKSYELFKHNALFAAIDLKEIETLFSVTKESILEPGNVLTTYLCKVQTKPKDQAGGE